MAAVGIHSQTYRMVPVGKQGSDKSSDFVEELLIFHFSSTDTNGTIALKYVGDGQTIASFGYLSATADNHADGIPQSDGVVASGSMTVYREAGTGAEKICYARILGPQKADA